MKLSPPRLLLVLTVAVSFLGISPHAGWQGECRGDGIDFGRDIRPILSDKCFQCHGADEGTRAADLRLDLREIATALREGQAAIVPGKPRQSLLVDRISSPDPNEQMPPPDSNKSLSPTQVALLRAWIAEGAAYEEHWAFRPVPVVALPSALSTDWARNPIDIFIERKLQSEGLSPSPEADRATLIRRLYQDLIGLLPSRQETREFLDDHAPDAYDRLVDRLLQSPHYGERWGRYWLDQARYADSHGFTIDSPRGMWPYRDWVIQAFNSDLPFDQFTIEQLAGDLLPNPTKSQRAATAFHRNTMINQEGGVKADQYRHEAVIDRVNTTGTVWLGLTIGCAQCHSHKFDPVSHTEYYRMYAFFNGCQDANNTGATVPVYRNELLGWSQAEQAGIQELQQSRAQLQRAEKELALRELERLKQLDWQWGRADNMDVNAASNSPFVSLPDGSYRADQNVSDHDTYHISFLVPPAGLTAIRLRLLPDETLPGGGPGLAANGNFFLNFVELQDGDQKIRLARAWASREAAASPAAAVLEKNTRTGWSLPIVSQTSQQNTSETPSTKNEPVELVLQLAARLESRPGQELTLHLSHEGTPRHLIGRFAVDLSSTMTHESSPARDSTVVKLRQRVAALEQQLPSKGQPESLMIMADLPQAPPTYVLQRGDFLQPATENGPLSPGVPEVLTQFLPATPVLRNRLDLARWLVSPDNPLTARVTVNRIWMRYFGLGLVETENDFGYQGSLPTHPELLDWLAGEFMRQQWSMKQIHRLIVTSATYRQSSSQKTPATAADPRNLLLGRQSRLRADAETIRDMALSASGKLTSQLGGPSVFPPQPDGVYSFTQTKKSWPESQNADRYRRTLYTTFYRSAPYPLLATFDAPDFTTACTQRPRSNTPLQALTLANDVIFMELARGLAEQMLSDLPAPAEFSNRLDNLFERCLTRSPDSAERSLLSRFWKEERDRYTNHPQQAGQLAGEQAPTTSSPAELAAWISVARVLLNTDEFVTRN